MDVSVIHSSVNFTSPGHLSKTLNAKFALTVFLLDHLYNTFYRGINLACYYSLILDCILVLHHFYSHCNKIGTPILIFSSVCFLFSLYCRFSVMFSILTHSIFQNNMFSKKTHGDIKKSALKINDLKKDTVTRYKHLKHVLGLSK